MQFSEIFMAITLKTFMELNLKREADSKRVIDDELKGGRGVSG